MNCTWCAAPLTGHPSLRFCDEACRLIWTARYGPLELRDLSADLPPAPLTEIPFQIPVSEFELSRFDDPFPEQ